MTMCLLTTINSKDVSGQTKKLMSAAALHLSVPESGHLQMFYEFYTLCFFDAACIASSLIG